VGAELGRIAAPLWPADATMFTATVAAVREYLGEGVFAAAAAESSTLPFEQLIAEQPAVAAPPPGQHIITQNLCSTCSDLARELGGA